MIHTVTNIAINRWQVNVSFTDEGIQATASNIIIGTEEQAHGYAPTLARDFRENHHDLFPLPVVEEQDHMMEEFV